MKKSLTILILFISTSVWAGECTEEFSWLPNSESNLAGYKIYYGIEDGVYLNHVDVGKPATIEGRVNGTVTGLDCGQPYYFVCVAYNFYQTPSEYSEAVFIESVGRLKAPQDFRILK